MQPRKWSPPAIEPAKGPDPSEASARSPRRQWGALDYVVSFVFYMLLFGVIAGLLQSRFPIDLGMFLFFTNTFGSIEPASTDAGCSISGHPGIRTRNQPFFASAKSPLWALLLKSVANDQNMGDRYL